MKKIYTIAIWTAFILFEFMAQITSKLAADSLNMAQPANWFHAFITTPWLWLSVVASIISFFIWISILRTHKLSFAFLASSFCYVLAMLAGWVFFHEKISVLQIAGSVFIIFGITMLAKIDAVED